MPKFKDTYMEYVGEGEMIYDDNKIPIKFKCQQLLDGQILGNIESSEKEFLYNSINVFLPFKISGLTNNGLSISIESIYLGSMKFIASKVKVKKGEITSNDSEIIIIFGITNFKSFRTVINTNIGELVFKNFRGYKNIVEDIDFYKKACITGEASLTFKPEIKANSAKEYMKLAQKEINRVLYLTSFSQGIYQTYKSIEVFEKIGDGNYEKIYFLYLETKDKNMGFRDITHFYDLTNYLSVTYPNYTDEMEKETGIQLAIEWYLEALASNVVESSYIMAFICLELLVDRYEAISGDKILDETVFKDLHKELKKTSKSFFNNEGIDAQKRRQIYENLIGLNRFTFKEQFYNILKYYKIGYTDIFQDLSEPIKIRNKLVHSGIIDIDFDLTSNYNKLMVMNQRIILSILNYDNQSFIDWLDNHKSKKFNRDPKEENKNF